MYTPEIALFRQIVLEQTERWMQTGQLGSVGQVFVAERIHGHCEFLRHGGHRWRGHWHLGLRRVRRIPTF